LSLDTAGRKAEAEAAFRAAAEAGHIRSREVLGPSSSTASPAAAESVHSKSGAASRSRAAHRSKYSKPASPATSQAPATPPAPSSGAIRAR
jgi:hypothetical protein